MVMTDPLLSSSGEAPARITTVLVFDAAPFAATTAPAPADPDINDTRSSAPEVPPALDVPYEASGILVILQFLTGGPPVVVVRT